MSAAIAPNVLVVLTDQQRWDTTGVHGNPLGLTPTFDSMAQRGVHLTHSFTCQPVCAPSRATLQTGQYPTTTGCFRNEIPLRQDSRTLAHDFADAGYETAYIGKWHLADSAVAGPVTPGSRGGYRRWLASNLLEFTSDAYRTTLYDENATPHEFGGYRADALGDAAIRFLREPRASPFFLFLSFLEPHHQNQRDDYPGPEEYRGRFGDRWMPPDLAALGGNTKGRLDGYCGMVKRVDDVLHRILAALSERDAAPDTIVLFTSDHGCHFKTRNDEYKRSCHDASIRVPTAMCGPGLDVGVRLPELASHVDLPPTLLAAAGLPVPERMQGRSLLPLVEGARVPGPDEVLIQISESELGRALRTRRWKYGVVAPGADGWNAASSDRYVDTYLYDLATDPHELRNLVGRAAYREVIDELRGRLIARIVASGEPPPVIEPHRGEGRCSTW